MRTDREAGRLATTRRPHEVCAALPVADDLHLCSQRAVPATYLQHSGLAVDVERCRSVHVEANHIDHNGGDTQGQKRTTEYVEEGFVLLNLSQCRRVTDSYTSHVPYVCTWKYEEKVRAVQLRLGDNRNHEVGERQAGQRRQVIRSSGW